jgi:hypothetical protein
MQAKLLSNFKKILVVGATYNYFEKLQKIEYYLPKYDQINNNCYAFICRFLNKISFQGVNDWNKETLADSILKSKVLSWEYFCYAYKELDKVITDSKNKTTSCFKLFSKIS